jgi:putative flippase GtrA
MTKKRSQPKFIIFSLIGFFNTAFDLVLYIVLFNATQSIILANTASTSAALIGSYFLNSRYTFRNMPWTKRRFLGFVAVTLFGLWVLQTALIALISPLLKDIPFSFWQVAGSHQKTLRTALPKILATGVTFLWNFVWYNKVIFRDQSRLTQAGIALDEL